MRYAAYFVAMLLGGCSPLVEVRANVMGGPEIRAEGEDRYRAGGGFSGRLENGWAGSLFYDHRSKRAGAKAGGEHRVWFGLSAPIWKRGLPSSD